MSKELEAKTTNRLAIITVMTAMSFAILEYFKDNPPTFPEEGIETLVSIVMKVSFDIVVPLFFIYLSILALSYAYSKPLDVKWCAPFYDMAIALNTIIITFATYIFVVLTIAVHLQNKAVVELATVLGIFLVVVVMILTSRIIGDHFQKVWNFAVKILKILLGIKNKTTA